MLHNNCEKSGRMQQKIIMHKTKDIHLDFLNSDGMKIRVENISLIIFAMIIQNYILLYDDKDNVVLIPMIFEL